MRVRLQPSLFEALQPAEQGYNMCMNVSGVSNYRLDPAFMKYKKDIRDVENPGIVPAHLIFDHVKQKLSAMPAPQDTVKMAAETVDTNLEQKTSNPNDSAGESGTVFTVFTLLRKIV